MVFNPADHDRKNGFTGKRELTAEERKKVLRADTSWILTKAEAIALLPGWSKSDGAKAEKALADAIGLTVLYLRGAENPDFRARRLLDTDSATRKTMPVTAGVLDYFPDAIAEVARVSFHGNEKHNPGEPLHWARGKSMDHADCIGRHLIERGGFDGSMRHSAALAWRALALLQEELEAEKGLSAPRNARDVA